MSKQASHFYEFDDFRIDIGDRLLTRAGETIPLAPKVFELLLFFVENRGRLLDKETLLKCVWPSTFVEESNLTKNVFQLRRCLGEGATGKPYIRTFPRRGYRFDADVVEVNLRLSEEPDKVPPRLPALPEESKRLKVSAPIRARLLVGFGCAALLISLLSAFSLNLRTGRGVRSLVVVPFRVAGSASYGYLSEVSAEELSFRLAKIRGLRVVAPQMAAPLRNVSDPHELGRRLAVDGVITGSLRTDDGRLRASVQLIAARDGTVLWADDSLDEGLGNPVESLRRLANTIVSGVRIGITDERNPLLKTGANRADAHEVILQGRAHYATAVRTLDRAEREAALRLFERAVAVDPESANGHAWLALARVLFKLSSAEVAAAKAHARSALSIDPDHVTAFVAMVEISQATGQLEEGLSYARRVVMRTPDDPVALALAGRAYFNAGMVQKAIALLEEAVAKDPERETSRRDLSLAYIFTHQNDRGLEILAPIASTPTARWIAMFHHSDPGNCGQAMDIARSRPGAGRTLGGGNYLIGIVAEQCGDRVLARQIWSEDARRLEDELARADSPHGRSILALDYAELGHAANVRDQVQRAQLLYPGHPYVLYYSAEAYAILGEWRLALNYLNEAVNHGFVAIHYIDHRQQPFYPLANLRDKPEFRTIRETVARRVADLEKIY